ncbi:hypothetical protein J18TS1_22800 [Oceanobacillus oncorhynchi subsp. incaldanensis]|nr:hypothetical protein J18TS1_22800 [Oceanobacillus oncorhynchi subsp. incaldanensis]
MASRQAQTELKSRLFPAGFFPQGLGLRLLAPPKTIAITRPIEKRRSGHLFGKGTDVLKTK